MIVSTRLVRTASSARCGDGRAGIPTGASPGMRTMPGADGAATGKFGAACAWRARSSAGSWLVRSGGLPGAFSSASAPCANGQAHNIATAKPASANTRSQALADPDGPRQNQRRLTPRRGLVRPVPLPAGTGCCAPWRPTVPLSRRRPRMKPSRPPEQCQPDADACSRMGSGRELALGGRGWRCGKVSVRGGVIRAN